MKKEKIEMKQDDALKGFLFRRTALDPTGVSPWSFTAYNARCYKNVGQALPDSRESFIKNNSCVVGPEQQLLRTSVLLNNTPSSVLTGHLPPHGEAANFNAPSPARGEENSSRGFTLIELLVVVLIIGILAAVALPQYQKAVTRTRYQQAVIFGDLCRKAQQLYHAEYGKYTTNFNDFTIVIPSPSRWGGLTPYIIHGECVNCAKSVTKRWI